MTDPERLSLRSKGLAAELLRAASDEQPSERGMQQTLLALGVSGVMLGTTSAAAAAGTQLASAASTTAAASGVGLASSGAAGTVSAVLIAKWVGIGVLGGFSVVGAAAVATRPPPRPAVAHAPAAVPRAAHSAASITTPVRAELQPAVVASATPASAPSATQPRGIVVEPRTPEPAADESAPLAAEVAYVDRARGLLAAGQSSQALSLLAGYERRFHEARLLPEVLFLQLEGYERAGLRSEAQRVAERLVSSFPTSPHAGRARKLLRESH